MPSWHIFVGMYIFGICFGWVYKFVLDITCQFLGEEGNLESFLVPFWHIVVRMYNFGICVSWLNICVYWIYNANSWGMNVIWRVSLCTSGTGLGECTFWDYVSVE